jgi:hypothetical protein
MAGAPKRQARVTIVDARCSVAHGSLIVTKKPLGRGARLYPLSLRRLVTFAHNCDSPPESGPKAVCIGQGLLWKFAPGDDRFTDPTSRSLIPRANDPAAIPRPSEIPRSCSP